MTFDITTLKRLGYNMLRKHVKVEPALYYAAADELGILIMQDMPCLRPSRGPNEAQQAEFQRQLEVIVMQLKSYTSIFSWVSISNIPVINHQSGKQTGCLGTSLALECYEQGDSSLHYSSPGLRSDSYCCAISPKAHISLMFGDWEANGFVCSRPSTTKAGVRSPTTQNSPLPRSSTNSTRRALLTPSVAGTITALVSLVTITTTPAHNAALHGTPMLHSTHLVSAFKANSVALVTTSQLSTSGRLSVLSRKSTRPTNYTRRLMHGTYVAVTC